MSDVSGYTKFAVADSAIARAPAPPVYHAWYVPSNGADVEPRLAHSPSACRGSAGLQQSSTLEHGRIYGGKEENERVQE